MILSITVKWQYYIAMPMLSITSENTTTDRHCCHYGTIMYNTTSSEVSKAVQCNYQHVRLEAKGCNWLLF